MTDCLNTPITRRLLSGAAALLTLLLAGGFGTEPPPGKSAEEPWLKVLRLQLKDNNTCALDRVLFVRELDLGKSQGLEGRVRCIDGREYDFTRQNIHQKFDIRLCQPAVC